MQKITPFLMFEGNAEEAINFYMSLFKESEVVNITRYGDEGDSHGKVHHAKFKLNGQEFMAIDSSVTHEFAFTPSISFYVRCETMDEINEMFEKLSEGGQIMMPLDKYPFSDRFGWLSDRFGVSWQLNVETVS